MRIAVIVTVNGFSQYLRECLDSIAAQNLPAAKVVLVCDSIADTESIRLLVPSPIADITELVVGSYGSASAARNAALNLLATTSSEFDAVAICDHDDAWQVSHLQIQSEALKGGAVAAFGDCKIIGPDGRATGEVWPQPASGAYSTGELIDQLYADNFVCTSSVVVAADVLLGQDRQMFDQQLRQAEDLDLWLRIAQLGPIVITDSTVNYRRHPEGTTNNVLQLSSDLETVHRRHSNLVSRQLMRSRLQRDRLAAFDGAITAGKPAAAAKNLMLASTTVGRSNRTKTVTIRRLLKLLLAVTPGLKKLLKKGGL